MSTSPSRNNILSDLPNPTQDPTHKGLNPSTSNTRLNNSHLGLQYPNPLLRLQNPSKRELDYHRQRVKFLVQRLTSPARRFNRYCPCCINSEVSPSNHIEPQSRSAMGQYNEYLRKGENKLAHKRVDESQRQQVSQERMYSHQCNHSQHRHLKPSPSKQYFDTTGVQYEGLNYTQDLVKNQEQLKEYERIYKYGGPRQTIFNPKAMSPHQKKAFIFQKSSIGASQRTSQSPQFRVMSKEVQDRLLGRVDSSRSRLCSTIHNGEPHRHKRRDTSQQNDYRMLPIIEAPPD